MDHFIGTKLPYYEREQYVIVEFGTKKALEEGIRKFF